MYKVPWQHSHWDVKFFVRFQGLFYDLVSNQTLCIQTNFLTIVIVINGSLFRLIYINITYQVDKFSPELNIQISYIQYRIYNLLFNYHSIIYNLLFNHHYISYTTLSKTRSLCYWVWKSYSSTRLIMNIIQYWHFCL